MFRYFLGYFPAAFFGSLVFAMLIASFLKKPKGKKIILKKSFTFYLSLVFAAVTTTFNFFRWEFGLFAMIGIEFLLFGFFVLSLFFSFIYFFRHYFVQNMSKNKVVIFVPLLIVIFSVVSNYFLYYPFTRLNLKLDFYTKLNRRVKVVEMIKKGELLPTWDSYWTTIYLPEQYRDLSKKGFISVNNKGKFTVTFFTFVGILGNGSGFAYISDGSEPTSTDLNWCDELLDWSKYAENWYFVTCSS